MNRKKNEIKLGKIFFYPLQVFDTSDLPGGVVNILTGSRDHLTKYLTEHQDVQVRHRYIFLVICGTLLYFSSIF